MLILNRRRGEAIVLDGGIRIVVLECDRRGARIGIDAPIETNIQREEIVARVAKREQTRAGPQERVVGCGLGRCAVRRRWPETAGSVHPGRRNNKRATPTPLPPTVSVPPHRSTNARAAQSPSPSFPGRVVKKGRKMSVPSAMMPGPSSSTATITCPGPSVDAR